MYDMKWIRDNPEDFDKGLKKRGLSPLSEKILKMDKECRGFQTDLQDMQARRNDLSRKIGELKKKGEDAEVVTHEVSSLKNAMLEREKEVRECLEKIEEALSVLPNRLQDDVPEGKSETDNVEVRRFKEPVKLSFAAKEHDDLGVALGMVDFDQAAKVSGARFVYLKGALARLERAIAQFMLDTHTGEHGYSEMAVPYLVKSEALFGTGQLPKFAEDLFRTEQGHWLIPTAEVPLTNYVLGKILDEDALPMRITALTPCFRSEAGAAGKDTKGMIRQHQFNKVELVSVTKPEQSVDELERMVSCAENILKKLELPYRVVCLCSGDTGFGSVKTYDIEVWLPGQGRYREISSCSNCGNFQALRMDARMRIKGQKGTVPVHTLNGSGVAVGRALIAVMENYQDKDGSIRVPEVLKPYMGGLSVIQKR